jgi:hypothetical protein
MRLAIEVFIARPYSEQARMNVHSCSQKDASSLQDSFHKWSGLEQLH